MSKNENKTAKGPEKVKVELLKNHTHAGKDYQPGDKIEVRKDQAKRLIAQKIAR